LGGEYRIKDMQVGDRLLFAIPIPSNGRISHSPTMEFQEAFLRTKGYPREAIRNTWLLAERELHTKISNGDVSAYLSFRENEEKGYGCESVRHIIYRNP
jgi:hypothetical protein